MPRAPVRGAVAERAGQGEVGPAARPGRGALQHGRAHQRVAHVDVDAVHPHQPGLLGVRQRVVVDALRGGGPQHHVQQTAVVGGHERQHPLRRLGEPQHPAQEQALHVPGERQDVRQRLVTGELPVAEGAGHLHERQGVPRRSGDDRVADRRGDRPHALVHQRRRGRRVQATDDEGVDTRGVEVTDVALPSAEDHRDALVPESAGHEQQRVGGGAVEPVRVVDEAQDRPGLGQLREHAEAPGGHQEPVLAAPVGQPQGRAQGGRLRPGQGVDQPGGGAQQGVEPGERQLRLRLDAAGPQHPHVGRPLLRVLDQGGLAGAGRAAQHHGAAPGPARLVQQCPDALALGVAADQHPATPRRGPCRAAPAATRSRASRTRRAGARRSSAATGRAGPRPPCWSAPGRPSGRSAAPVG